MIHNYNIMEDVKEVTKTTKIQKSTAVKKSPAKKQSAKKPAKKEPAKKGPAKKESSKKEPPKIVKWTKDKAMPAVGNAFRATGRGIGHAFMEISDSLAGWFDDTSKQLKKEIVNPKNKKTVKKVTTKTTKK